MAGDINFKLHYIVPLHPGIPWAHTVRKLGPEIPSELALSIKILTVFNSSTLLSLPLPLLQLICFFYLLPDPHKEQVAFTFVHPSLLSVKHGVKH